MHLDNGVEAQELLGEDGVHALVVVRRVQLAHLPERLKGQGFRFVDLLVFRVQGSGFRVQGSGYRAQGSELQGSRICFRFLDSGFWGLVVSGAGIRFSN